jgi:glycerophosphoryl diester phosphodiesterase
MHSLILGHRGASGHAPENTLASFRLAFQFGADGLEFDVHESKEGALVVCHDPRVDRTTDGSGEIRAMNLAQIKKLDAGSWYGKEFAGERMPTLQEVFAIAPFDATLNIEVKKGVHGLYPLEKPLANAILASGRLNRIIVSSFETKYLINLHRVCPQLRLGQLIHPEDMFSFSFDALPTIPLYSLHPYFAFLNEEWVMRARQKGYRIFTWTANDKEDIEYCTHIGCDGIITNYPDRRP